MFKSIKDTNTGVVYDWIKKLEDGTEISVNLPETMWKREQDWTHDEIEALFFSSSSPSKEDTVELDTIVDDEEVLNDEEEDKTFL